MEKLTTIRRMWDHVFWADRELLGAMTSRLDVPEAATREFAHVIGTEEVWLARLEGRAADLPVWPAAPASDLERLVRETHKRWITFLEGLTDAEHSVEYVNSAGGRFENSVGDILTHVALHGQYHRGKVNLLLRQAGREPAPVDYIAFIRGAPAATEADAPPGSG